jgi:hypothetical protein
MALTNPEVTALRSIITREGGIDAVLDQVRALSIADRKAAADAALASSISVAVNNWAIPAAYVATARGDTLPSVIGDIGAAWAAHDQSRLGALFVQLFAASKAHLGL